jgi:purine nucleoside phosphorylase
MKIAVSACLLGENCKYNGGNNYSEKVRDYINGHEVIPVCPEVLGGLSIPREPAEIVNGIVSLKDGTSVDKEFREGARTALETVKEQNVDIVILQSRSPSCGVNAIYDGSFSGRIIPGQGIFADLLRRNGIKAIDVENL